MGVLAMLFEELVEQHRVHGSVADGAHLAVIVASHRIWTYLFYFLCNKPEPEWTRRFNFVNGPIPRKIKVTTL
jgi:hypothetical protein